MFSSSREIDAIREFLFTQSDRIDSCEYTEKELAKDLVNYHNEHNEHEEEIVGLKAEVVALRADAVGARFIDIPSKPAERRIQKPFPTP